MVSGIIVEVFGIDRRGGSGAVSEVVVDLNVVEVGDMVSKIVIDLGVVGFGGVVI